MDVRQAQVPNRPTIVQIAGVNMWGLVALLSDGTLWNLRWEDNAHVWKPMPSPVAEPTP